MSADTSAMIDFPNRPSALSEPVSILMPVHNECEGIESVVVECIEVIFRHLPHGSEFLILESGSDDGTKEVLKALLSRWPFLKITCQERRSGFAAAARELYYAAACPLVFFADSDGQCVAADFWRLVPYVGEADFILGRKAQRRDPFVRRIMSRTFNKLADALFQTGLRDINYGFRLSRREPLLEVLGRSTIMPTLLNAEIVLQAHLAGYRIKEVPVHHRPRIYGAGAAIPPSRVIPESIAAFRALLAIYFKHKRTTLPCAAREERGPFGT